MSETPQQLSFIIVMSISASLSFIGSFFIIVSAIKFRELMQRSFALRIVFIMSTTDFIGASFYLSSPFNKNNEIFCKFQAGFIHYANLSGMIWTCCYAFSLYLNVVKHKSEDMLRTYMWKFTVISFGIPAFSLLPPIIYNAFGPLSSTPWCWIEPEYKVLRIVCYYGFVICGFFFNLILFIIVTRYIKKIIPDLNNKYLEN